MLVSVVAFVAEACGGAPSPTTAPTSAPAASPAPTETSPASNTPVATPAAEATTASDLVVDKSKLAPELSLYSWSDYVTQEVLDKFQQEYGVKVTIDNYDTNEALFAKFQAGGNPGYDLIVPSDYMVEKMIAAGMLEKIDFSNVPNIRNLDTSHYKLYF